MVDGKLGLFLNTISEFLRAHASAREIDPREVGAFQLHRGDPGDRIYAFIKELSVAIKIGAEFIHPSGPFRRVGGCRHEKPKAVGRQTQGRHAGRKPRPEIWVFDDDVARMTACDVEGLGCGGHHHQTVRDAVDMRHRDMRVAWHRQIMVDFV